MEGKVKFYNKEGGWGFLTTGNADYFFCHTGIVGPWESHPTQGDKVIFTVNQTDRGPRAERVSPAVLAKVKVC